MHRSLLSTESLSQILASKVFQDIQTDLSNALAWEKPTWHWIKGTLKGLWRTANLHPPTHSTFKDLNENWSCNCCSFTDHQVKCFSSKFPPFFWGKKMKEATHSSYINSSLCFPTITPKFVLLSFSKSPQLPFLETRNSFFFSWDTTLWSQRWWDLARIFAAYVCVPVLAY